MSLKEGSGKSLFSKSLAGFEWSPALVFITARALLFLSLPIEGLRGYGDLPHFFRLAALGIPFVDLWLEFPPVFPFVSRLFWQLAVGKQHAYDYLLVALFTISQAGSVVLFTKLVVDDWDPGEAQRRSWLYLLLTLSLAYGWWYFDSMAIFAVLLGLYCLMRGRYWWAGIILGLGMLTKWFPVLVLVVAWRFHPWRKAFETSLITLVLTGAIWGGLLMLSPDFTVASLRSQINKGSWETVWALLDGNLRTGNFGPEADRRDPESASWSEREPPVISPWLTLTFFAGAGAIAFIGARAGSKRGVIAFLGLAWCIFLLWSPGWSPQWVLYLLPLILLTVDYRLAIVFSINLIRISILEWPVLLSRGRFDLLWLPILTRSAILLLLSLEFSRLALWYPGLGLRRGET